MRTTTETIKITLKATMTKENKIVMACLIAMTISIIYTMLNFKVNVYINSPSAKNVSLTKTVR